MSLSLELSWDASITAGRSRADRERWATVKFTARAGGRANVPRGPHGNQAYLFMMGDQAGRERASTTWSLQHRLPDGHAWVEIGHFPTKELATETANAFVVAEYGKSTDFRVQRSKVPQD